MVPIYSIDCALSLWFPEAALFIDMARDCYEAYVLYLFFALLMGYVSNGDEYALVAALESEAMSTQINLTSTRPNASSGAKQKQQQTRVGHYGKKMSLDPKDGEKFLRYCRFGTLQYCLVRPVTTILAFFLSLFGLYHESEMSPFYGYFWIMIILNISVMQALFALIAFYETMKSRLDEFDPLPKFLCVKAIIFFAFWQGIAIMILVELGIITSMGPYKEDVVATVLQDLLICLEMPLIALAHTYAFSVDPFLEGGAFGGGVESGYMSNMSNGKRQRNLDAEFGTMEEPLLTSGGGLFGMGKVHTNKQQQQSMMMQSNNRSNTNPFAGDDEFLDDHGSENRSTWGNSFRDFFGRNFAYNEAIRDFNSSMPVLTIPSGFAPTRGESIPSNAKWRTEI
jgi:hypothetical protein